MKVRFLYRFQMVCGDGVAGAHGMTTGARSGFDRTVSTHFLRITQIVSIATNFLHSPINTARSPRYICDESVRRKRLQSRRLFAGDRFHPKPCHESFCFLRHGSLPATGISTLQPARVHAAGVLTHRLNVRWALHGCASHCGDNVVRFP